MPLFGQASRRALWQFVEDIAWGSSVWRANELYNIIHFTGLPQDSRHLPPTG